MKAAEISPTFPTDIFIFLTDCQERDTLHLSDSPGKEDIHQDAVQVSWISADFISRTIHFKEIK